MKNVRSIVGSLLTYLALLIITTNLSAQGTGEIRGRIVDSLTNEPIPFATVAYMVSGTLRGEVADVDGYFKIKPLNPGFYDLTFSFVAYNKKQISGVHVSSDKISDMRDVKMNNGSLDVIEIVDYYTPIINFEDPVAIPLTFEDIERSAVRLNPMALIASVTPDIKTSPDGKKLYFRGGRAEAAMYIVDGVKTRNGRLGIPGSAIGHLTVYTGGVPAKYGDFTGGVVVIETKSYFDIVNQRNR